MKRLMAAVLLAASVTAGCSSAPRSFEPAVVPPPVDPAAFKAAYDKCLADLMVKRPGDFGKGRLKSAGGGAAVGYGGAAVLGAGETYAAVASAVTGLIILTPLAMYGVSRAVRARKEHDIQKEMSACLEARGYHVAAWNLLRRPRS